VIGSDMLVRRLWSASESACRRRNVEAIYLDQWNEAKLASAGLALDRVIGPPPTPVALESSVGRDKMAAYC